MLASVVDPLGLGSRSENTTFDKKKKKRCSGGHTSVDWLAIFEDSKRNSSFVFQRQKLTVWSKLVLST